LLLSLLVLLLLLPGVEPLLALLPCLLLLLLPTPLPVV
jgi:hypothetical protein